ncbi:hypothetical protein CHS0354_031790 [Potamilus streckersoni]|uniref:Uncharacterized protein n=1 Tax=Potamilus streckersoni TaxID=2493646 RepID=A0AAE0RXQ9_9BIVA|nr:hypothetical protein CHS0354_031790 [Potamilus streckersoni]
MSLHSFSSYQYDYVWNCQNDEISIEDDYTDQKKHLLRLKRNRDFQVFQFPHRDNNSRFHEKGLDELTANESDFLSRIHHFYKVVAIRNTFRTMKNNVSFFPNDSRYITMQRCLDQCRRSLQLLMSRNANRGSTEPDPRIHAKRFSAVCGSAYLNRNTNI